MGLLISFLSGRSLEVISAITDIISVVLLFVTVILLLHYTKATKEIAAVAARDIEVKTLPAMHCGPYLLPVEIPDEQGGKAIVDKVKNFKRQKSSSRFLVKNMSDLPIWYWVDLRMMVNNERHPNWESTEKYYNGQNKQFIQPKEDVHGVFKINKYPHWVTEVWAVLRVWVTSNKKVIEKFDERVTEYDTMYWKLDDIFGWRRDVHLPEGWKDPFAG